MSAKTLALSSPPTRSIFKPTHEGSSMLKRNQGHDDTISWSRNDVASDRTRIIILEHRALTQWLHHREMREHQLRYPQTARHHGLIHLKRVKKLRKSFTLKNNLNESLLILPCQCLLTPLGCHCHLTSLCAYPWTCSFHSIPREI